MSEKQKSLEHGELIEREQELREQIEESRLEEYEFEEEQKEELLNYRTYFTSLIKGRVTDIDCRRGKVVLEVRTKEGTLNIPVKDTGEYSEDNELIRLLEWKNISDGRIGDLLDEKVTIRLPHGVFNRDDEIDESGCSVYVPRSFDAVGKTVFRTDSVLRRLGIVNFEEGASQCEDGFEKVLGSMLIACFVSIVFLVSVLVSIPAATLLGETSAFIMAILMTVFIGVEFRIGTELFRRYKKYRNTDQIQK